MAHASALYAGFVTHQRFAPTRHRLRYAMFQMLLDLDEAPTLGRDLRLFSHNRFNVFSFYDRDHGDGREGSLRSYVEETLAQAGIAAGGAIQLLCMPRLFGHVFNPLSLYFCRWPDGTLAAMLYEVNNTFGQRHSYLIAAPPDDGGPIRQSCAKAFHVSPFMDMAMIYDFTVTPPGDALTTAVNGRDRQGAPVIAAIFTGRRKALTDGALFQALFAYPLLTLKVVAAIHWEALKLILKGVRMRPIPPPPSETVTLVR